MRWSSEHRMHLYAYTWQAFQISELKVNYGCKLVFGRIILYFFFYLIHLVRLSSVYTNPSRGVFFSCVHG